MKKTNNNYKAYINKYGERVMRVSEIIKLIGKEQITIWANMLGFKGIKYKDELERTANIGSLSHSVIEISLVKIHFDNRMAERTDISSSL